MKKMCRGISGRALYIYIYDVPRPKIKVGVILKTYFFMIWSRFGHAMRSIYKGNGKEKTTLRKYFLALFFIRVGM